MKKKITKQCVDETPPADKPVFIFDTELAGFVLKINPTGRRIYQLRYRMGGRTTPLKTYTIGKHGSLTPHQARRMAQTLLGDVRRGIDPAAERAKKKSEDRGALTVEQLSAEFLEIYGRTKLKPRSLAEYERAFRSHINPRIGGIRVREVTNGDVDRLHHAMRATPPTANRTVAALSKFFSWAIRGGYRPDNHNPCRGLEKYKEHPRKRYLASSEIAVVGEAIRTCEADGRLNIWQAGLIRSLLLTGLRRDELRTLEWRCVDFERGVLILEDPKGDPRDVPMSAPLQLLLNSLPRLAGNPFVFPGSKSGRPLVNLAKPWRRVLAEAAIDPTRIHDLRHTAASIAVSAGASLPLIGGVLGHKSPQTTSRYAHLSDDPVRALSDDIAHRIDRTLEGMAAEVTPFRQRNRK